MSFQEVLSNEFWEEQQFWVTLSTLSCCNAIWHPAKWLDYQGHKPSSRTLKCFGHPHAVEMNCHLTGPSFVPRGEESAPQQLRKRDGNWNRLWQWQICDWQISLHTPPSCPSTLRLPLASPCALPWGCTVISKPAHPALQRHLLHWLWKAQQTSPGRAPAEGLGCNPGGSAEAAEKKTFKTLKHYLEHYLEHFSIVWTALLQDLWWKLLVFSHEQPELCSLCFDPALKRWHRIFPQPSCQTRDFVQKQVSQCNYPWQQLVGLPLAPWSSSAEQGHQPWAVIMERSPAASLDLDWCCWRSSHPSVSTVGYWVWRTTLEEINAPRLLEITPQSHSAS